MIKKVIGVSDIHIKALTNKTEYDEVLPRFYDMLKDEMEGYEPDEVRIVIAGDIFDTKISITNEDNVEVSRFISNVSKYAKTIVIAGNHDYLSTNMERLDSLSQVFIVADFKNAIYLDRVLDYYSGTYEDDNIVWCLYSTFNGFNKPEISAVKKVNKDKTFIGLVHGDVNGARTDTGFVTENGLKKTMFKGVDFTIAGHIHKHQTIDCGGVPLVYCGSLIQQNFGENISGHGYVVWDIETKQFEYKTVDNSNYGKYYFEIENPEDVKENKERFINF